MKKLLPPVVIFFLAPTIAELLSGSAPPVEFFNPFGLVVLTALYGSGALLARELRRRWHKGWLSLFALGAAYGILEEGLMIKSFFDPTWVDLGILGSYGRWAGVNWVWSLELTLFHAVVSIAIPILLVELMFPERRDEPWVGRGGLIGLSALLAADVAFGYFFLTNYSPPLVPYLVTLALVIALVLLAWRLPRQLFLPKTVRVRHPFCFWLVGFSGAIGFFLVFWGLPNTNLTPWVTMFIGVGLVAMVAWVAMRMSGKGSSWSGMPQLALAAGPLSLFILLAPVQEFDTSRTDNTAGMTIVGVATLLFLLWMWWRVRTSQARLVRHKPAQETDDGSLS